MTIPRLGKRGKNIEDLSGEKFNMLTIIRLADESIPGKIRWLCKCECGNTVVTRSDHLRSGNTKSCGCQILKRKGLSDSPEYRSWFHMIDRCEDETRTRYGGRGISVCKRWRESFELFIEDMGPRPSLIHSIERINNDGNYTPDNCHWALPAEQTRNKINNHLLTYKGETKVITDWSREKGVSIAMIIYRLGKGMSVEEALDTPVGVYNYIPEDLTKEQIEKAYMQYSNWRRVARELGISFNTLSRARRKLGCRIRSFRWQNR